MPQLELPQHLTRPNARIYVSGHRGMVGSACCRLLNELGLGDRLVVRTSSELDLRKQDAVNAFFAEERPASVIFAAGRVGGIHANKTHMAEFMYDNMAMATNAINAAFNSGVERFLFLGSTCIYPRDAPQPVSEETLLTAPLEPTNEGYALAKITGLKLCEYLRRQYGRLFHTALPTNMYGPRDNYHPDHSHVVAGLLRRFHEATVANRHEVVVWGSGKPLREFMHVDDAARAILHLLSLDDPPHWINVGTGKDVSIAELANMIAATVGYQGRIVFDSSKPDGTPRKLTDVSRLIATGWAPTITLQDGIASTYEAFRNEMESGTVRSV